MDRLRKQRGREDGERKNVRMRNEGGRIEKVRKREREREKEEEEGDGE